MDSCFGAELDVSRGAKVAHWRTYSILDLTVVQQTMIHAHSVLLAIGLDLYGTAKTILHLDTGAGLFILKNSVSRGLATDARGRSGTAKVLV